MAQLQTVREAERPRFTARLVFMEDPSVAETIAAMAERSGHSIASEVRGALRYWIDAHRTTR